MPGRTWNVCIALVARAMVRVRWGYDQYENSCGCCALKTLTRNEILDLVAPRNLLPPSAAMVWQSGEACVALAALGFSLSSLFVKLTSEGLGVLQICTLSSGGWVAQLARMHPCACTL
jgi:hypothetical protein